MIILNNTTHYNQINKGQNRIFRLSNIRKYKRVYVRDKSSCVQGKMKRMTINDVFLFERRLALSRYLIDIAVGLTPAFKVVLSLFEQDGMLRYIEWHLSYSDRVY